MGHGQRGPRSELAHILSVDVHTLEDLVDDASTPVETVSMRLGRIISHAVYHPVEARIVHAFLPTLMQRIFGYTAGLGWLEAVSRNSQRDRDALLSVVAPFGPVHTFCVRASDTALYDHSSAPNSNAPAQPQNSLPPLRLRFEFPVRNLPHATRIALRSSTPSASCNGGSSLSPNSAFQSTISFLAPLLAPYLKPGDSDVLLLDALTYFVLCMLASPMYKVSVAGVPDGMNPITRKRIRRSSSLPSTRALYNQLIAAYAATTCDGDPNANIDPNNVFIPAVLDFFFLPNVLASLSDDSDPPQPSPATVDAATSILITLLPSTPASLREFGSLDLRAGKSNFGISHLPLSLSSMTYTQVVYSCAPLLLFGCFKQGPPTNEGATAFLAQIRALALYITPWKGTVRSAVRSLIFPRDKSQSSNAEGVSGMTERAKRAAFFVSVGSDSLKSGSPRSGSTTDSSFIPPLNLPPVANSSSLRQHLASPQRSPHNASNSKESRWRAAFDTRLLRVDIPLVCTAVVFATTIRVAVLPEGVRSLAILADAAYAARSGVLFRPSDLIDCDEDYGGGDSNDGDGLKIRFRDLELSIDALRSQVSSVELKNVSKAERGFVSVLSSAFGVRSPQAGVLRNFSEIMHGGAQGVRGMVDRVTGTGGNEKAGAEERKGGRKQNDDGGNREGKSRGKAPSESSSGRRTKVLEKRISMLSRGGRQSRLSGSASKSTSGLASALDAPFLGTVWDRPIESGECEPLVIAAYWLALQVEPHVGFLPNTRFLGRVWLWFTVFTVVAVITLARAAMSPTR